MLVVTRIFKTVITTAILFLPTLSIATAPLMDTIEYEGSLTSAWPAGKLPENSKLAEFRRKENCTARGGPRANWRIASNRLWLVGLFGCGGKITLGNVYDGAGESIFAEWFSGNINTNRGKQLCTENNFGIGVFEKTITFEFDKGVLTKVVEVSNTNHPDIPTFEDFKKWGAKDSEAQEFVSVGGFPCIDHSYQTRLQSYIQKMKRETSLPNTTPGQTTTP
jgi:hypothetical protein